MAVYFFAKKQGVSVSADTPKIIPFKILTHAVTMSIIEVSKADKMSTIDKSEGHHDNASKR